MAEAITAVLDQLDQLEEVVLEGSRIPFTGGRLVREQDAVEVIDALRDALPREFERASQLLRQKEDFIAQARQKADEIVASGRREREQLIANQSVRQEVERQVIEMREQARQQCEQMLQQARQHVTQAEQEHQSRMAQLEQQYATRRQQLEQEAAERNRQLVEQHDRNRQQAMAELEQIRQEGLRVQRESQAEAERLHNDALQFRQQTQQHCDQLVARCRQEAATISEGANRYAEQVLSELESRLKEIGDVVIAGRQELMKLQVVEPGTPATPAFEPPSSKPLSRRRRMAEVLRRQGSEG